MERAERRREKVKQHVQRRTAEYMEWPEGDKKQRAMGKRISEETEYRRMGREDKGALKLKRKRGGKGLRGEEGEITRKMSESVSRRAGK